MQLVVDWKVSGLLLRLVADELVDGLGQELPLVSS